MVLILFRPEKKRASPNFLVSLSLFSLPSILFPSLTLAARLEKSPSDLTSCSPGISPPSLRPCSGFQTGVGARLGSILVDHSSSGLSPIPQWHKKPGSWKTTS